MWYFVVSYSLAQVIFPVGSPGLGVKIMEEKSKFNWELALILVLWLLVIRGVLL